MPAAVPVRISRQSWRPRSAEYAIFRFREKQVCFLFAYKVQPGVHVKLRVAIPVSLGNCQTECGTHNKNKQISQACLMLSPGCDVSLVGFTLHGRLPVQRRRDETVSIIIFGRSVETQIAIAPIHTLASKSEPLFRRRRSRRTKAIINSGSVLHVYSHRSSTPCLGIEIQRERAITIDRSL